MEMLRQLSYEDPYHIYPFTGKDELDSLVCFQHMGLHGSVR